MAEFRFEAVASDGAEVRDTIKALDHESAQDALREKGLLVYRLKSVGAPEDLERRCAACNQVNNWNAMVCTYCGAPVRGPHVGPDEHIELTELPRGLVIQEYIDGSITVTKAGWRRWEWAWIWLVVVGWVAVGWVLVHFYAPNDLAHRFAGTVIGLPAAAALVACTVWALFARDEWHVGAGFFELRRSLFGMDWGHTFRAGIIRIEQRTLRGPLEYSRYRVSVLDRELSRWVCEDFSESAARTLAALLAQRTGWVLDDQIRDWSWLDKAFPSTLSRWWRRLRGQR